MDEAILQTISVGVSEDVSFAAQRAKDLALKAGFESSETDEIALAVRELASNLINHASGGILMMRMLSDEGTAGIEIESLDQGPGIFNRDEAMTDGFSTRPSSLGYGLGTVIRAMDQFEFLPRQGDETGTHLVCRRWRRGRKTPFKESRLEMGVATRPHPAETVNGDTFVAFSWDKGALAGVIDGLGHGPLAREAALTARNFVERHHDRPLDELFLGVSRVCRGTRGVVMALARFDPAGQEMNFCSIGNIDVHVLNTPEKCNFVVRRGILGANAPRPVITRHPWNDSACMVLHSDGVGSRWRHEDLGELWGASAERIASEILRRFTKDADDATVVVVKSKAS